MGTGYTNLGGDTVATKEQVSEKVKIKGGDRMSVRIKSDADGIEKIIPGSLLMRDSVSGLYVPMLDSDGTPITAANDKKVGVGDSNFISHGIVKISIDFYESTLNQSNMLAVVSLGSMFYGQFAYNHEFMSTPPEAAHPEGAMLYISDGLIKVADDISDFSVADNGMFIIGHLEKTLRVAKHEVMVFNTVSGGYLINGAVSE